MDIEQQIKRHQRLTNVGILLGLVLTWGPALMFEPEEAPLIKLALWIVGVLFFIWGCRHYAMSKGRHPAWGWLGLLNVIGLVCLVAMGNRPRRRSSSQAD
jgi:hypothetical protein